MGGDNGGNWNPGNSPLWQGTNFDPTSINKSSMANGGGTPWAAGNKNGLKEYGQAALTGLAGASLGNSIVPYYGAAVGGALGLGAGATGLDYAGQERSDSERANQQQGDAQKAQALRDSTKQQGIDSANKAAEEAVKPALDTQNSFEQAYLGAAKKRNQPGGIAFGGFNGR